MATKFEINLAKEIKMNFILILIGVALTITTYGIMYIALKPPVNDPVPEYLKERIRSEMVSGNPVPVGNAFSNDSKYDIGLTTSDILVDRINENRMNWFKQDISRENKNCGNNNINMPNYW